MKKYVAGLHLSLIVLILSLLFSLNFVAYSFEGIITAAICGTGVNLDKDAMGAATEKGTELAQTIAEEGITLLKNENDALPLKPDADGKITLNVFGKGGCDTCFVYQGYGSGGGSREPSAQISLYTALRGNNIAINEDLAAQYNKMTPVRDRGIVSDDKNIYNAPKSFYSDELMRSTKAFSDNAMIVIGRCLGEAYDAPDYQTVNGNTARRGMECGFLQSDKIDAALTLYAPGNAGSVAVGAVLTGSVSPSGRTVDTWAYDFETSSTYANAGVHGSHQFSNMTEYVAYARTPGSVSVRLRTFVYRIRMDGKGHKHSRGRNARRGFRDSLHRTGAEHGRRSRQRRSAALLHARIL